jgi:hypothetical protein
LAQLASFGVRIENITLFFNFLGYFIKLFPLRWFGNLQIKEEPLTDEQEAKSLVAVLRKSHRQTVRNSARETREYNERETQRVSGRSTRSRREHTSMNNSRKLDLLKVASRTSYQQVPLNTGRHSLNPDLRD